jgi:hypothetical protein
MINENIHDHLSDKEVRDYLSREYQKSIVGIDSVEWIQKEIERLQNIMEISLIRQAVKKLIDDRGWQVFDISDKIPYNRETYFDFVGTVEEYENLLRIME